MRKSEMWWPPLVIAALAIFTIMVLSNISADRFDAMVDYCKWIIGAIAAWAFGYAPSRAYLKSTTQSNNVTNQSKRGDVTLAK